MPLPRYAISLTSIPPRYGRLRPVLDSLLAQRPAPARVILALPLRHARFGPAPPPDLPPGVELMRPARDEGPATKVLPVARALGAGIDRLIYCDDDWIMPAYWAARLLAAGDAATAAAGAGFDVQRLRRCSHRAPGDGGADVAQGYAGVSIRPQWLAPPECTPPPDAFAVDDIWLSGQLARQGIALRLERGARAGLRLAFEDAHALQDARIAGRSRHAANLACAALLTERYGLWPPRG